MSHAFNRGTLSERARMLRTVRQFFFERSVLEVDTNILSATAPVDAYIDVMRVEVGGGKVGYLHTSPEYGMKKLLAQGSGDIFQLGHVFRANEEGPLHMPEFTMLEWYRIGMSYEKLIEETLELIRLFLGNLEAELLTYREAFLKYAQVDPFTEDISDKVASLSHSAENWDRDTQLNLLFSHLVEPQLGKDKLTTVTDYPATQAALAKTAIVDKIAVAKRYEIYYLGVELANGFDELSNGKEQHLRFYKENEKRVDMGKEPLPIDEEFVAALDKLPESCGVAVGFDRLMQLTSTCAQSGTCAPR